MNFEIKILSQVRNYSEFLSLKQVPATITNCLTELNSVCAGVSGKTQEVKRQNPQLELHAL